MDNTYFLFNNKYYKQSFVTPMGSPISGLFADLVMDDLESECLRKLSFKPIFFYRYVDDIIMCIPNSGLNEMLDTFNLYNSRLQFTHEIETKNSISFLDILLIKENQEIITNWYTKPTFSGRFLNYHSQHPLSQKIAMVYNVTDRAIKLADFRFHKDNINIAKIY